MSESEKKQRHNLEKRDNDHLSEIADKRREAIKSRLDEAEKAHHEKHSEREAIRKAKELAKESNEKQNTNDDVAPHEKRSGAPSKKQLRASFNNQMKNVRAEMSPANRIFSKFIHAPFIEKTSTVIGSTIARPNAMLAGSIAAFLCIAVLYFIAHHYGYQLSGFETIGAFIIGWLSGILYDLIFRGRQR